MYKMQKKVNSSLIALPVQLLSKTARLPKKGSDHSAGYDLYSSEKIVIPAKNKALVSLGISMAIPLGCYGRIAPRSGLAVRNFIDVGAGVVDSDYRGEVKVLLFNFGTEDFTVNEGDRIAQLIIEKIALTSIMQVDTLDQTQRGHGGFGSTGVSNDFEILKNRTNKENLETS